MSNKIFYGIFLVLLAVPASAFAQTDSLISVQTDDSTYDEGDSVVISGQVSAIIAGTQITLKVSNEGRLVEVGQIKVAQDGSYSHIIIAQGALWSKEGEYLVEVSYGKENAETRFNYFPRVEYPETTNIFEVGAGSSGTFDVKYTINGGTLKNMQINERNFALVVTIDSADEGTITLDLPRSAIDAKEDQRDVVFIILIDDSEVPYQESTTGSDSRVITINFEEGDSEIWIIGTWIIPEFGTMAMIVLAAMVMVIIFLTKNRAQIRI